MRREKDHDEPDRRTVRNLIRRGKAPRLSIMKGAEGLLQKRGKYVKRSEGPDDEKARAFGLRRKQKRVFILRMSGMIRYTTGLIFKENKPKESKGLLSKLAANVSQHKD